MATQQKKANKRTKKPTKKPAKKASKKAAKKAPKKAAKKNAKKPAKKAKKVSKQVVKPAPKQAEATIPAPTADLSPEHRVARAAFDSFAAGASTVPLARLSELLSAIGHPEELEDAKQVIDYVKRFYFDCAPAGELSWIEVERFLNSARPTRNPSVA
jgi:hypothetical protein